MDSLVFQITLCANSFSFSHACSQKANKQTNKKPPLKTKNQMHSKFENTQRGLTGPEIAFSAVTA